MVKNESAAWKVFEIPTQEKHVMCTCVYVCLNTTNYDSKHFFKCSR